MKLQQNQVWRQDDRFIRIVQLERMTVDYKLMQDPVKKEGTHHHATKKEFCRLLRGATLISAADMASLTAEAQAAIEKSSSTTEPSLEASASDGESSPE